MILRFLIIALIGGILFAAGMMVRNYLRTVRFQKHAAAGMECQVYKDENLCHGKIESRTGNQVTVRYYDDLDNEYLMKFHAFDIYPVW